MKNLFYIDRLASDVIDEEAEFIPLLSNEDEEKINKEQTPEVLPILPLRNTVLFPGVVIPITVGRDKSTKLIKSVHKKRGIIGVVSQKDLKIEDPKIKDLNTIGTEAQVMKMLKMPDGNLTVIIQGRKLMQLNELVQTDPFLKATVSEIPELKPKSNDKEFIALVDSIKDIALQIAILFSQFCLLKYGC